MNPVQSGHRLSMYISILGIFPKEETNVNENRKRENVIRKDFIFYYNYKF